MSNFKSENTSKRFQFSAIVEKRNHQDLYRFGCTRILLREIRLNGNLLFRDHLWIRETKKTKNLKIGDFIQFNCAIKPYLNVDDFSSNKIGLVSFKGIRVLKNFKKFRKNDDPYRSRIFFKKCIERSNKSNEKNGRNRRNRQVNKSHNTISKNIQH